MTVLRRVAPRAAALAFVLSACVADAPPVVLDAGPPPDPDAFFPDAAPWDAPPDALGWIPDAWPPAAPVLPRQSWTMRAHLGAYDIPMTLVIDERSDSGVAVAIGGAGGHATTLVFDIAPGGLLVARNALVLGLPDAHVCSYDRVIVSGLRLTFVDGDGDGVHETLQAADGDASFATAYGSSGSAFDLLTFYGIASDETPPTLQWANDAVIPGVEDVVLVASEPIDSAFAPRLVGPRSRLLALETGSSSGARWSTPTSDLPIGHYEVVLGSTPRDLAGLEGTSPAPLSFDVGEPLPPIDGIDASIVRVAGQSAPVIVGDDPGETALDGATSVLFAARFGVVFDAPAGAHAIRFHVRTAASVSASVTSFYTLYDSHGVLLTTLPLTTSVFPSTATPGYANDDGVGQLFYLGYTRRTRERLTLVSDIAGSLDTACSLERTSSSVAATIDEIHVE